MMISKQIKHAILANPQDGPTPQALTHGSLEIKVSHKRGPIMARKVAMHERLYARGKIDDAQWNWACRYVRETEIAAGARPGRPEFESAQAWAGPLIYNRQCAAAGFLRRAHERISYAQRLVLIAACVECLLIADLAALLGLAQREGEEASAYINRISARVNTACASIIKLASAQKDKADATTL